MKKLVILGCVLTLFVACGSKEKTNATEKEVEEKAIEKINSIENEVEHDIEVLEKTTEELRKELDVLENL